MDEKKREHRAALLCTEILPQLHKPIKGIIRDSALELGWRAKYIRFQKDRVEFVLKPYPLEARLREQARSEEFRQAARKKRAGTPLHRACAQIPEP